LQGSQGYIQGDVCHIEYPDKQDIPLEKLALKGKHNMRNCLSAILAASSAGVSMENILEALGDFPGVEHRLEFVKQVNGVTYINDSKATNVDACYCALDSMTTPVVLIIGGKDKGNDYSAIVPLVQEKCRALVFLGADNSKLHETFGHLGVKIVDTNNMPDCVAACAEHAAVGDTVLLSPCCASFDLFSNMEDRGEQFKENVRNL
jgi:UDP-N-acetylmuramoylalanine--D-glutamate ligase